jgi:hypothetical protein
MNERMLGDMAISRGSRFHTTGDSRPVRIEPYGFVGRSVNGGSTCGVAQLHSFPSTSRYYVYVIELDDAAGPRLNPDKPNVYVGQSSLTPKQRFEQHQAGIKSSKWVRKYGRYLRPRLYEHFNPMASREAALDRERWLRERLEARGFTVYGGH